MMERRISCNLRRDWLSAQQQKTLKRHVLTGVITFHSLKAFSADSTALSTSLAFAKWTSGFITQSGARWWPPKARPTVRYGYVVYGGA
jgi:hypothetical protein